MNWHREKFDLEIETDRETDRVTHEKLVKVSVARRTEEKGIRPASISSGSAIPIFSPRKSSRIQIRLRSRNLTSAPEEIGYEKIVG
jgi:hypothetical protein